MVDPVPLQAAATATATASDHYLYLTLDAIPKNRKDNLKVSLPDIDDHSMNAVFAYLEFYEQDLAWSFISDSFFFSGGILYVVLSFGIIVSLMSRITTLWTPLLLWFMF
jgi:hypothetical protein